MCVCFLWSKVPDFCSCNFIHFFFFVTQLYLHIEINPHFFKYSNVQDNNPCHGHRVHSQENQRSCRTRCIQGCAVCSFKVSRSQREDCKKQNILKLDKLLQVSLGSFFPEPTETEIKLIIKSFKNMGEKYEFRKSEKENRIAKKSDVLHRANIR